MTKREKFEVIGKVFAGLDIEVKDEIVEFVQNEIAALDAKNEKAKIRAAAKRAEGDELRAIIKGVLTDEPKTINDIIAEVGDENLTPAKVVARLTQLKGEIRKEVHNIEGRKLTTYALA